MQVLGVSLAVMGVVSVAIFEFAIKGGVTLSMEEGHVKTFKGEEYEAILSVNSRGTDWIGSIPTTFSIETAQLMVTEVLTEGRIRLHFLGNYAGRSDGVRVGISLTDPLKLLKRLDQIVYGEFILDTLPLSLLAPVVPRKLTVFGFGERPTGYPGPGQELYGLDEYHPSGDTKDIIWKRVAKSPDETLIARVRESHVREFVRVGVVRFAERGEKRAEWIDKLCEALGFIGKEVFEMGATFTLLFPSPGGSERGDGGPDGGGQGGVAHMRATDINELAEAVMSCSVAPTSIEIGHILDDSDFVVTGFRELEDAQLSEAILRKPTLLISDDESFPPTLGDRSVVYSGKENLFPLIRKLIDRR